MFPKSKDKKAVFIESKRPFKDDINAFIYRWNALYPIDRWWRERHNVAFNSPEHRVVSFLDIYIEWQENQLVIETKNKDIKQATYKPGDFLEERKEEISIEDEIKAFEEMNFSKYDDKK